MAHVHMEEACVVLMRRGKSVCQSRRHVSTKPLNPLCEVSFLCANRKSWIPFTASIYLKPNLTKLAHCRTIQKYFHVHSLQITVVIMCRYICASLFLHTSGLFSPLFLFRFHCAQWPLLSRWLGKKSGISP